MVFINIIEKHLLLVEIMDNFINNLYHIDKINQNSNKIEEIKELVEVSNMKLNELKTVVRQHDNLISKTLNYKYYYNTDNTIYNYYGIYTLNFVYIILFIYIINKLN